MARKTPLSKLLQDYRSEIRTSGNPAHNKGKLQTQIHLLQRTQDLLWEKHDWAFLRVERFTEAQAGQRYIDLPDDLPLERLEQIDFYYSGDWIELKYGITSADYALYDSYTDERFWPVEAWQIFEDEQIELWPIPASNSSKYDNPEGVDLEGRIRFKGIRKLRPLVAESDTADLDDRLIVLTAAAETLAADGAPDAPAKAAAAAQRFKNLVGNVSKKKKFRLFGRSSQPEMRRPPIPSVHYRET